MKFGYSTEDSGRFIDMIMLYANLVHPKQKINDVLKDKDDHIILECAIDAEAKLLVTADRGLLKLKEYQEVMIIHPTMLQYLK